MPYPFHIALILTLVYLAYQFLLSKETFYKTNRYILLFGIAVSFILPIMQISQEWSLKTKSWQIVSQGHPGCVHASMPNSRVHDLLVMFFWPCFDSSTIPKLSFLVFFNSSWIGFCTEANRRNHPFFRHTCMPDTGCLAADGPALLSALVTIMEQIGFGV